MAGLLDFDYDAEMKRQRALALIQAGLTFAGARKGQEMQMLAPAFASGMGTYLAGSENARRNATEATRLKMIQSEYDDKQAAARAAQAYGNQLAGAFSGAPDLSQMGPGGPTPDNAAAVIPSKIAQYQRAAEIASAAGRTEDAKRYIDIANSFKKKYSQTPQVGVGPDGKPYQYVLDDEGNEKRLNAGVAPKFREVNTGGKVQIVNDYNLPAGGTSFDVTMNPAEADASKRGWANFGLAQNADRRAAAAAAQANEPAWVNDLERGIQIDPRSGQSRPIMAGGQPVGAKGESKKAESAESAQKIIDLAKPLIQQSTGSYTGAAFDQVMQGLGISTSGADAAAQLQVLQARLMTEQPRMEGPQSDRDVELYRKAAGEIGNPNVPNSRKMAALKMIEALNDRYRKKQPGQSAGATGGWSISPVN